MLLRISRFCLVAVSFLFLNSCNGDGIVPPDIPTTRKFVYPAAVGETWHYASQYSQAEYGYAGGNKRWRTEHHRDGVQSWSVQSVSIRGSDTVVHLHSAKHDTVHLYAWDIFSDTIWVSTFDSVYFADTTIQFAITLFRDSISVNFRPTLYSWFWGGPTLPVIENFGRTLGGTSDTISCKYGNFTALYVNGQGLVHCLLWQSGNSYSLGERLDLLR